MDVVAVFILFFLVLPVGKSKCMWIFYVQLAVDSPQNLFVWNDDCLGGRGSIALRLLAQNKRQSLSKAARYVKWHWESEMSQERDTAAGMDFQHKMCISQVKLLLAMKV